MNNNYVTLSEAEAGFSINKTEKTFIEKVKALCDKITSDSVKSPILNAHTRYVEGSKYIKVNLNTCGKYMIDKSDGVIYGIKAYNVINKKKSYGTLDSINDYFWGNYTASLIRLQQK